MTDRNPTDALLSAVEDVLRRCKAQSELLVAYRTGGCAPVAALDVIGETRSSEDDLRTAHEAAKGDKPMCRWHRSSDCVCVQGDVHKPADPGTSDEEMMFKKILDLERRVAGYLDRFDIIERNVAGLETKQSETVEILRCKRDMLWKKTMSPDPNTYPMKHRLQAARDAARSEVIEAAKKWEGMDERPRSPGQMLGVYKKLRDSVGRLRTLEGGTG